MSNFWAARVASWFVKARHRRSGVGRRGERLERREVLTPTLVGGVGGSSVAGLLDINSDLELTFSEAIQWGSAGEIRLFHEQGHLVEAFPVALSTRLSIAGTSLTINPTWDLDGSGGYFLQIDPGSIRGFDGSGFAGVTTASTLAFRTGVEVLQVGEGSSMRDEFPGTASEAIGNHRALYMRVTFTDVNRAPNSMNAAAGDMSTLGRAYIESSRGVMPVTTTYTPVLTVPFSYDWFSTFDTTVNGLSVIQVAAQAEAARLGYRADEYNVRIVRIDEPLRSGASWGGGDSVWVSWGGASVLVHEAGHAIGFGHAKSTNFSGQQTEYGNSMDWMGSGDTLSDFFGVSYQAASGWIESGDVLTNPGNGIYRLHAVDAGRNFVGQYYGLKQTIAADALGANPTYTLEFRPMQGGALRESVVLLRNNMVIDLTPGTADGFRDGGIRLGQTYLIPGSNLRISVIGAGDGYVEVDMEDGAFGSNVAPTAEFSASATEVQRFGSVTFSASALDQDGDDLLYSWAFGDGVTGFGKVFTRSFAQSTAQSLSVDLNVSDRRGGLVTVSGTVSVGAAATGIPGFFGASTAPALVQPSVSIVAADAFSGEGGDSAAFRVSRIGTSISAPLNVSLSYSGSALSAFASLPTTVVIPAGETSILVSLDPVDDSEIQSSRTLDAVILVTGEYTLSGQNSQARIHHGDDDTPVLTVTALDATATEAAGAVRDTGVFVIHRTGPLDHAATVYYGISGTADNGGDFVRLDGKAVIQPGEESVAVVINPLDDAVGEMDETVTVTLSSFGNLYSAGEQFRATVTIGDTSDLPTVTLRASTSSVEEGVSGVLYFEAVGGDGSELLVPYALAGTATAGVDFETPSGEIRIPAGHGIRTAVLNVRTLLDGLQEDEETVIVTLSASTDSNAGVDRSASIQINDALNLSSGQDQVSVSRHFANSSAFTEISESSSSPVSFWVYRKNTTSARNAVTVTYALSGTATPGVDYSGVVRTAAGVQLSTFTPSGTNTVTIPADATGVLVELIPLVDGVLEGTESITITIESAAGNGLWIPRGISRQVSVSLLDSDVNPVRVMFSRLASLAGEPRNASWGSHTLQVSLSQASEHLVNVDYTPAGGSALGSGGDWSFVVPDPESLPVTSGTLTFAPGETSKLITVWVQADRIPESAEFFDVRLQYPHGASMEASHAVHRVNLYDVVPEGLVTEERWSGAAVYNDDSWNTTLPMYEGYLGGLTTAQNVGNDYSRRLRGYITAPVSGSYTFYLAGDDAAKLYLSSSESAADRSLIASLTSYASFQQWDKFSSQRSAAISLVAGRRYYVEVLQKENSGGDHVSVGWVLPGESGITPISTVAAAASTDNRYVQFVADSSNLVEGEAGRIQVSLDRAAETSVTVNVAVVGNSAVSGTDFSTGSLTLTFAPGELTRSIVLNALVDSIAEAVERVDFRLVSASGARISGRTDHVLSIVDVAAPEVITSTGYVARGQANGTKVVQLSASVASGRTVQSWQIVAGNARVEGSGTAAFAIDGTGLITVANTDALPFTSVSVPLTVRVTDNQGASSDRTVTVVINGRRILEERWADPSYYYSGDYSAAADVSVSLSEFDAARDVGDYYSRRIVGILSPTVSGAYSFWVAARDAGRLTIASISNPDVETDLATSPDATWLSWDTSYLQQSAPQQLVAGQEYILRAYQTEQNYGDNLSVAWSGPGFPRQVIPASAFRPAFPEVSVALAPRSDDSPASVTVYSLSGTALTDSGVSSSINAGQFTKDSTLRLSGTAPVGAVVRVYAGSVEVGQAIAQRENTWALTTTSLADGIYEFRAEVADVWGNLAITQPVTFEIRSRLEVENFALVSTGSGASALTTSGAAVSSVLGFSSSNQGSVVYTVANGAVADLMVADGGTGQRQLVTRSAASAGISAGVSTTYAGFSEDGALVLFGSNAASSFGNQGIAFIDENVVQSAPYSDLFAFDRTTGEVRLITYGSAFGKTRSRQAELTGVTADGRFVIYTTDYVEQIGSFVSPSKPESARWALVEGGYPSTGGKLKSTALRVADIDPGMLTIALSGAYISNKGMAAHVSTPTIARTANTLSFWVQGLDGTYTKAVKLELSDSATGILVKATAARYTTGDHPDFNWNTGGTAGQVATSSGASGYGISVLDVVGSAQTATMLYEGIPASRDIVAYEVATGQHRLLSHSAIAGHLASGSAGVSGVTVSGDGKFVLFTANDAGKFGNTGVAFVDAAPLTADLFAASLETGEIRLLSRSLSSELASVGVSVELLGTSPGGGYAVFRANDAGVFGFADSMPEVSDLFVVNVATGAIRLITNAGGSGVSSMAQAATLEKVSSDAVFFSAADATKAGFTSDGGPTSNDLFRFDLATGQVQLISHSVTSTQQALNAAFRSGSITVSPDGRFVVFASYLSSTDGGFAVGISGDALFLADIQTGAIRLLNGSNAAGSTLSYGAWAGLGNQTTSPRYFTSDSRALVWQTSYLVSIALEGRNFGPGVDWQYGTGVLAFDVSDGVYGAGTTQYSRLLSHTAASVYQVGLSSTLRGVSGDSRTAVFSSANASSFGNEGVAYTDSATSADDLFAVDLKTQQISLLSGADGHSFGQATTFYGVSRGNTVLFGMAGVDGLSSLAGPLTDSNGPGQDLVVSRLQLIDLPDAMDTAATGNSTDNITTKRSFSLSSWAPPGQTVQLLDNGSGVGVQTAPASGLITWSLTNVAAGQHVYTLWNPDEEIPLLDERGLVNSSLTVTVVAVYVGPTDILLSSQSLAENSGTGAMVATLSTVTDNLSESFTYSLVSGTGATNNSGFEISGNVLRMVANADYESQNSHTIRIRSTSSTGQFLEKTFVISITNVNESPTGVSISSSTIAENAGTSAVVGNFSTNDPDAGDTFTYELVVGAGDTDNDAFAIIGRSLVALNSLNFESKAVYSVRIRAMDQGGLEVAQSLAILVTNVNEAPVSLQLSAVTIPENSAAGTTLALLTTTDPDTTDTFIYSLVSGLGDSDNARFEISGDSLRAVSTFDFETRSSYSIRIRSTDAGGLAAENSFTITVLDVNESPSNLNLSSTVINENLPIGTVVGTFSAIDQDSADSFTWYLVSGTGSTNNALFTVAGNELRTAAVFDYESVSSYSVRMRVQDHGGLQFERAIVISVGNVDETPPVSLIQGLATPTTRDLPVSVIASDPGTDASGIARVDLYYSTGGAYRQFASLTPANFSTTFTVPATNTTYWLRSLAVDLAGNSESKSGYDVVVTVGDVDRPETQVASVTADNYGKAVLQLTGTRQGRAKLQEFVVYGAMDGQVPAEVGRISAGVANASGLYSAEIALQLLADNIVHKWDFYTRGVDTVGNIETAPSNPDATISRAFSPTPLRALDIDVHLGMQQRSWIRYLDILFSQTSGITALANSNRIRVERFSVDTTSAAGAAAGTGASVAVNSFQTTDSRLRLDFGSNGLGGLRQAGDGFYRVRLDMDGDAAFDGTDDAQFEFFRLFGDVNGDSRVDEADSRFVASQLGRTGPTLEADADGSGAVNTLDRQYTIQRRGRHLRDWMLGWLDD